MSNLISFINKTLAASEATAITITFTSIRVCLLKLYQNKSLETALVSGQNIPDGSDHNESIKKKEMC